MLPRTGSREFWCFVALLVSGFLFSLWRLGSLALFDLDEGGYAEIAREMLVLDDWIIPRLNFVRLLDKPPLLYWLTAVSFNLFGISEFAARLPVALSMVGIMGLCAVVGRKFYGSLAGFLSPAIFATSAGLVVFETGRQLQPDILPGLRAFVSTKSLGTTLSTSFEPGERIVMDGLYEDVACVTFYSGQKISMVHGVRKDLAFGSRFPDAAGTFLEEEEFFRLWNSETRVYLLTDYPSNDRRKRDVFYSKLRLHYLAHSGSMKLFSNQPSSHAASGLSGSGSNPSEEWKEVSASPQTLPAGDRLEPAGSPAGKGGKVR